ncbi:MAG: DUF721 domain-containing protein [Candidatus Omnitrophota bacterium]|nr:DUF721 domain-containing protein [Candidatus Omnitrophota bacterium]
MESIKDILPNVIENLSEGKPGVFQKIHKLWPQILQPKILKHARPAGFKKGQLTINVDSPVWLFHLNFKRQEILAALQKEFNDLTTIKFRIGSINEKA